MSIDAKELEKLTTQEEQPTVDGNVVFTKIRYLEYKGHEFYHGDRVYISGERSKFFFRSYERNEKTGDEWVNVFEDNHYVRSFHLNRIIVKTRNKKKNKSAKMDYAAVCDIHPLYTARRRPRTGCHICMAAYEDNKK